MRERESASTRDFLTCSCSLTSILDFVRILTSISENELVDETENNVADSTQHAHDAKPVSDVRHCGHRLQLNLAAHVRGTRM